MLTQVKDSRLEQRIVIVGTDGLFLLESSLNKTCMLLGLQDPPEEMIPICKLIIKHFPNLSIEQVCEAFTLNSAGQLHGKRTEMFYNQFSWDYVGSVLRAYEITMREKKLERPETVIPVSNQLTTGDEDARWYKSLLEYMRNNELKFPDLFPFDAYHYLKRMARIAITKEQYEEHVKYTVQVIHCEALNQKRDIFSSQAKDHLKILGSETAFQNRCRGEYVKLWITKQLSENDPYQWIESELKKLS